MDSREYISKRLASDKEFRKEYIKRNLRFEISQLITEARIYKGLSQSELAKIVGTKQPSIARIESGKTLPSLSFLERMANAFKTYLIPPKFGFMEEHQQPYQSFHTINSFNNETLPVISLKMLSFSYGASVTAPEPVTP